MKLIKKIALPCAILISLATFSYYMIVLKWDVSECLRFSVGILALWGPIGTFLFILLRSQIADETVRFALSAISSYALTTLLYFACATVRLEFFFYAILIILMGASIIWSVRVKVWNSWRSRLRNWRQANWLLGLLIVLSLAANAQYQITYQDDPDTGSRTYELYGDHLYHTGLAYELDRHIPPAQATIRGGMSERAYHLFPHLTTMLLARFTAQPDMLRAHLVYHYFAIEVLMCLLLYSLAKTLTGSRWAGYITISFMYLTVVTFPPLIQGESQLNVFYFTLFPHASSGLEPVVVTSPQMYSGLVVVYGIMVGILQVSIHAYHNKRANALLLLVALMVGAMARFRIQIFLPLFPLFLLILFLQWRRKRRAIYLLAGAVVLLVSLFLYLETQSDIYLKGTAQIKLGHNGLTAIDSGSFINSWPLSVEIYHGLERLINNPRILSSVWPLISMSMFVVLNMIGIPLIIATIVYLRNRQANREFLWFSMLVCGLPILSILLGSVITQDYDPYAVAGQLLLHTRWYVFPLAAIGALSIYRIFQCRVQWSHSTWQCLGLLAILLGLSVRWLTPPSSFFQTVRPKIVMGKDEVLALNYIHDRTPPDSVIVSNKYLYPGANIYVLSGIGGRAAYLEHPGISIDQQALRLNPDDDRLTRIKTLWLTTSPEQFCQLILPTPITHLVEYADQPLVVERRSCMSLVWTSPGKEVSIWQIER